MRTALLFILLVLGGCATSPETGTRSQFPQGSDGALEIASLFPSDAAVLSDLQIEAILKAKSLMPEKVALAVVHLRHDSAARYWGWGSALEPDTRRQLSSSLHSALILSTRVARSEFLPSFLLPETPSVGHLREATARFQSDAVLVFRTECEIYQRYRFLRSPSAKATCRAEAALLDVRTGIVPFSTESLQDFEIAELRSDANFNETINRAEALALDKVLIEVGSKTAQWLGSAAPRAPHNPYQAPVVKGTD